ncbi:MAG: Crp/Fnr family transcriptional regulator [Desulfobacterales bacterium GWB2_56_26]|nr:MAG: Crp/Fnr family transcriptional regulator [Desulfobacterales bacterium GWB2_56_26]
MVKQQVKYRDAIFIVTGEKSCPIYNLGEELKVVNYSLSVPSFKPSCLFLTAEISKIVTSRESFSTFSRFGSQNARFDCGGCGGMIHFEFKKEKDFATLQMKLLNETEERRKRQHLDKFFGVLRNLDIFESLDDDALSDLTLLLELKTIPVDKVILKKGEPGSHLYIVLSGQVAVIADDRSRLAEMGTGEIFGEMSLLSGEPVTSSIHSSADTEVAILSTKNFKHVLKKYPILQIFLFKLLVKRAQTMSLRSGKISSGMTGELSEISTVDLFQLINSSQKTGRFDLILEQGKAMVFFKEGEIVHARFLELRNKEAIFALVGVKNGHFIYTKGIPKELDKAPPIGGFMGIIMEGLQRIDEHKEKP